MSREGLLISHGSCQEIWQLGALGPEGLLIGWTGFSGQDAGMPGPVASLLATALVNASCVTFLASERQPPPAYSRPEPKNGPFDRWLRRLSVYPERWLVTSDNPKLVTAAFDDASAPWWLQGQVLIGTDLGSAPPDLSSEQLAALLSEDWYTVAGALPGVNWVLRPGVDADVAGFCPRNAAVSHEICAVLEKLALSVDLHFEEVCERDFSERLRQ